MQHLPCFLVPSQKLAKVLIKYWTCRKCMFCGINQQPLGAKPIRTSRKLIESSLWDYWSWWNEGETRRKTGIRILCADHHVSLHFPISILIYMSCWCWYYLRIQWVLKTFSIFNLTPVCHCGILSGESLMPMRTWNYFKGAWKGMEWRRTKLI